MNTNIKLSLTNEQLNLLYRKTTGNESTKRTMTRAELNELVQGFVASLTDDLAEEKERTTHRMAPEGKLHQFDQSKVPAKYRDRPLAWQMGWYRGRYITQPY